MVRCGCRPRIFRLAMSRPNTADWFWSVLVPTEKGCLVWPGGTGGYGKCNFQGKFYRVHRLAWMLKNGVIPRGAQIRHTCDNPPCCNVDHLCLGTPFDNMVDRQTHGKGYARGSDNHAAKLSEDQVRYIRHVYQFRHPRFNQMTLSRRFGVAQATIRDVVNGSHWRHVV